MEFLTINVERFEFKVKMEEEKVIPFTSNSLTYTDVNGETFEYKAEIDEDSVLKDIWHVDFKNKTYTNGDSDTFDFEFSTEKDPTTIEEFEKALIKYYDDCYNRSCFLDIAAENIDKPWWNEFLELAEKTSSFDELEPFWEKNDIDDSDAWYVWAFKHGPYKEWEIRRKNGIIYVLPKDYKL